MAPTPKKMAAALAAIELYLHEEAAEAMMAAQNDPGLAPATLPAALPGIWSQSARFESMAARRMVQLRAFSRIR